MSTLREQEGPSLPEGVTTGADPGATTDRIGQAMGRWLKVRHATGRGTGRQRPKPGEPGYIRGGMRSGSDDAAFDKVKGRLVKVLRGVQKRHPSKEADKKQKAGWSAGFLKHSPWGELGGELSHTKYEGPSLVEQLEYIKYFLEEGKLDKLTPEDHYVKKETDRVKRLKSSKESWETIKKQMSDARKSGKPVTYRVEGGTGKTHGNPVVRRAARMYAKKHGIDYEEKSLEHPEADPTAAKVRPTLLRRHLRKKYGRRPQRGLRRFLSSPQRQQKRKDKMGPPDTFPRDFDPPRPATKWSRMADTINRARRVGFRKGLHKDVLAGRETVGTIGRDHIENPDYLKKGKSGKYVGEQVK